MKIRRFSDFQTRISFPNLDDSISKYYECFKSSDLGKIYEAIPWDSLVQSLNLKKKTKGPSSIFSPRGKLALMFLKNYCGCSDRKLIEQFNGNIYYQIFCDTFLEPGELLSNYKIVSQIRCELAPLLNIDKWEKNLMESWRDYMENLESITFDATCYESSIRYPTDVKLLYESVSWIYSQIKNICKSNKLRMPRTKIKNWIPRYISYSKMRRKTKKKRRSITRGLLRLLTKLTKELERLEETYNSPLARKQYWQRRCAINTILQQQSDKFYKGERPKNAIVSIDKSYIRPIVRGKEIKQVEFGAKVHKLQIDGISFIEHLSFDAFNEGTRLIKTMYKAQALTRTRVKLVGADAIYATNKNRNYLTSKSVQTDFKPKGRKGKHSKHKAQISKMITKERASRLEGSFGTDKEYFLLNRIKARTQQTEKLWIFIGIHCSNALNIGRRMANIKSEAA